MKSDIIYEKLGAYEDLEDRLQKIYGNCDGLLEKVIEALEQYEGIDFLSPVFKSILLINGEVERWEELKRLEQQKKLQKLPCAVGDTVYHLCTLKNGESEIIEMKVCCVEPCGQSGSTEEYVKYGMCMQKQITQKDISNSLILEKPFSSPEKQSKLR